MEKTTPGFKIQEDYMSGMIYLNVNTSHSSFAYCGKSQKPYLFLNAFPIICIMHKKCQDGSR